MDIKKDIIFWTDTGSNKEVLKKNVMADGHSEDSFNESFDEMISDGTLVLGRKSQFVVVAEWMPNTAEKLRSE